MWKLTNNAVAKFTAASGGTSSTPVAGPAPACEAVSSKAIAILDLEFGPIESMPVPAEDGDVNAIEKAVADLIGDVSPRGVNAPFLAGSDDEKPLAVALHPLSFGIAGRGVIVASAVPGVVQPKATSGSGTRSTLLTKQPPPEVASTRTTE